MSASQLHEKASAGMHSQEADQHTHHQQAWMQDEAKAKGPSTVLAFEKNLADATKRLQQLNLLQPSWLRFNAIRCWLPSCPCDTAAWAAGVCSAADLRPPAFSLRS